MNSIEQQSNEDILKKPQIAEEDSESKISLTTEDNISTNSVPFSLVNTSVQASHSSSNKEPSEISETCSLIKKDIITPLGNPNLKDLKYIKEKIPIYANLYKIELERNYILHKYSVIFAYEGDRGNDELPTVLKRKIINTVSSNIAQKFSNFIFIGPALFSEKKVEVTQITTTYNSKQYYINIQPTNRIIEMSKDSKIMMKQYKEGKEEIKSIFEIIVQEILRHSSSLIKSANSYYDKSHEKELQAYENYNDIYISNGYDIKVMIFDSGIYLNVDKKTMITSKFNCLQLIETFIKDLAKPTKDEIKEVNDWFVNKTIKTFSKNPQRLYVTQVDFERTPNKTDKKYGNNSATFSKYYEEFYGIKLNPSSPLLLVRRKKSGKGGFFFPPELCAIEGLTEEMIADRELTNNITKITKLNPTDKMEFIGKFISYINDDKSIINTKIDKGEKKEVKLKSALDIKRIYGLEILAHKDVNLFPGKIMKLPLLKGEKGTAIKNLGRTFKVFKAMPISCAFICHYKDQKYAETLRDLMDKAKKEYGIILDRNDLKSVNSNNFEDWTALVDECMKSKKYNIITFLISDYQDRKDLYSKLKLYTQEEKGFVTQFIKLKGQGIKKNSLSVVSNILIQMNSKIGGISCIANLGEHIKEHNFMIVGVDSSGYEDNGKLFQNISFCATLDKYFSTYVNKKTTVTIEDYDNTQFPIASFMEIALAEYFKKRKSFPDGVFIYRQGISKGQSRYLKTEIGQLNKIFEGESDKKWLKDIKIKYYYFMVNKKPSLKFFEKGSNNKINRNDNRITYDNPESGLLICDKVIDSDRFEFYIQPQKVTQGTATPTRFQVEYGNLDCPELLPKLTFDLCFLYSNWRGPVRVPAPLKYAEKLAKSKAGVHDSIKDTLSFI